MKTLTNENLNLILNNVSVISRWVNKWDIVDNDIVRGSYTSKNEEAFDFEHDIYLGYNLKISQDFCRKNRKAIPLSRPNIHIYITYVDIADIEYNLTKDQHEKIVDFLTKKCYQ